MVVAVSESYRIRLFIYVPKICINVYSGPKIEGGISVKFFSRYKVLKSLTFINSTIVEKMLPHL